MVLDLETADNPVKIPPTSLPEILRDDIVTISGTSLVS